MELSDCFWSMNIAEITVCAKYFGLALINNHLAFCHPQAGRTLILSIMHRIRYGYLNIGTPKQSAYHFSDKC